MKNLLTIFILLLLAAPALPQANGMPKTAKTVKPLDSASKQAAQKPLSVKDAAALEALVLKGAKADKYNLGSAQINDNTVFYWLYPKTWEQEKTLKKSAYEPSDHIPEAIIIEIIENKLNFLDGLALDSKIITEGEVSLLGKKVNSYKYADKDDPSLGTNAYIYKAGDALIGFTIIAPTTVPVTFVVSDLIENSGIAVFGGDNKQAVHPTAIAEVEISEPDVKNIQTIKFPEGQKFFYTAVPSELNPDFRNGRIYFNCPAGAKCQSLMFLQKFDGKITKEEHEAALSKNLGQLKRTTKKTETYGRLKTAVSKKEYKTKTITNYYFTNSEPFVLAVIAETKNDRKLNAEAVNILRNTRLTDK